MYKVGDTVITPEGWSGRVLWVGTQWVRGRSVCVEEVNPKYRRVDEPKDKLHFRFFDEADLKLKVN